MRRLTHVDTREVSLVTRAANRRRFALMKAAGPTAAQCADENWLLDHPEAARACLDAQKARKQDPNEDLPGRGAGSGYDGLSRKRDVPAGERHGMPASDFAGEGESFPIKKPEDVAAAAHSLGRTNQDRAKVKARIIAIARRKGAAYMARLPEAWKVQKGDWNMPRMLDVNDENVKAVLAEPIEGEDALIDKFAPNASDESKAAMVGALRLLVASSDETGPEAIAFIAKAAFAKADDPDDKDEAEQRKRKEEEERKRKEAEEEERKQAAAKMNRKGKGNKGFPGAQEPFGGDDAEDKRKRKEEEERKAAVAKAETDTRDKKIASLESDLNTERGLRLKAQAEKAADGFRYIPVAKARLVTLLLKADEAPQKVAKADGKGEQTLGEEIREVLFIVCKAMEVAGVLGQRGSDAAGIAGGAYAQLAAMARERVTKSEGKDSFEVAFSKVIKENPQMYKQYLAEEHPSH